MNPAKKVLTCPTCLRDGRPQELGQMGEHWFCNICGELYDSAGRRKELPPIVLPPWRPKRKKRGVVPLEET